MFTTLGKTLSQNTTTANLEYQHPLGMIPLICQTYSVCDIQDYFEFIIKKHEALTENPPIQFYPNKIRNRIVFKVKTGYELELLSPEMMKVLGSTKKDVHKDKNGEDPPNNKTLWRHRNDVSLYVPVTSHVRPK